MGKIAKTETHNIKILEAEKDFEVCKTFLDFGRKKKDDKLVENYLQDYTDSIKVLSDFKTAKGNESLSDAKKDFMKATKHKDFEAKRLARKEILNAKEKLVHAKSWKARELYKSATRQLTYAKAVDNLAMINEGQESLKDANKNLQESQVAKADLLFDVADDRLFYAKKEKNQGKIQAAKDQY